MIIELDDDEIIEAVEYYVSKKFDKKVENIRWKLGERTLRIELSEKEKEASWYPTVKDWRDPDDDDLDDCWK